MRKAVREGEIEASVALGFTAAIAALGLFFIPMAVGVSLESTGSPHPAWYVFIAFYLSCVHRDLVVVPAQERRDPLRVDRLAGKLRRDRRVRASPT